MKVEAQVMFYHNKVQKSSRPVLLAINIMSADTVYQKGRTSKRGRPQSVV